MRPTARRPDRIAATVCALAALGALAAATSCDGASDPANGARGGTTTANGRPLAPRRTYTFGWTGAAQDLPWNRTVFVVTTERGEPRAPTALIFFEGEEIARLDGRPGEKWYAHSEQSPTRAINRLLWTCRAEGTFGDADTITLQIPPRAHLSMTGNEASDPGADALTVVEPDSGARLAAVRDPARGLRFAVWDTSLPDGKDDWSSADLTAPPRPWVFSELRPGATFVVAAKCAGRQWLARRVTMKAGEAVTLDVRAQPTGGGVVVSDAPAVELLLGGDLPIAPLRVTRDFPRARWENVPPGRHAARYPGGAVVAIDVVDGEELKLPRTPATR